MFSRLAATTRTGNPLALLAAQLELLDGARRQLRKEPVKALEGLERSQDPDESHELGALAAFDPLEGPLADAGLLGKLGLSQTRLNAIPFDPLAQDLGDSGIGEFGFDLYNSSLTATR